MYLSAKSPLFGTSILYGAFTVYAAGGGAPAALTTRNFPLSLPGTPILIGKQLDPQTGAIRFISNSAHVRTAADLFQLEEREKTAGRAKHGALDGPLLLAFSSLKDADQLDVEVHLRSPSVPTLDPETHTLAELKENERAIESVKPIVSISGILKKFSGSLGDPVILDSSTFRCRLSKGQIELLRFDKAIDAISYATEMIPTAYAFYSLATSAYNPASSMPSSFKGQGVNAATFESGIANNRYANDGNYYPNGNLVNCLSLVRTQVDQKQPIWSDWMHSQMTFKCLWQAAPYANHFHHITTTNSYATTDNEAFIANNAIQSASMSYARALTLNECPTTGKMPTIYPTEHARGWRMARMDEWAYRYPYPVFCNPTANAGSAYEVNWQCYNALSVGNVRHTELRGYEIPVDVSSDMCDWQLSCTQTRNPPYDPTDYYGGPQLRGPLADPNQPTVYAGYSGDREMPYIVAPGITPASNGDAMTDQNPTCVDPAQCGTSLSAPTLNGIVACVLSSDSRMVNRPHAVWAVMLATAENVDGSEWNSNVDGRDGAGVVSGSSAVNFARNHSEPGPLAAAVAYGVSTANVDRNNPNGSTAKYNILIPNPKPAGKHLRVVLTWTSVPSRNPDDNYLSDLDLSVPYNGGTSFSTSYNGNVEIVDIPAANLTAGASYQSVVTIWASRFPPSGGISSFFKYAIAWNWVKDHAQQP